MNSVPSPVGNKVMVSGQKPTVRAVNGRLCEDRRENTRSQRWEGSSLFLGSGQRGGFPKVESGADQEPLFPRAVTPTSRTLTVPSAWLSGPHPARLRSPRQRDVCEPTILVAMASLSS